MLKKTSFALIAVLLFAQVFSSFALAVDNNTYYYFTDKVWDSVDFNYRLVIPTKIQFDSFYTTYGTL